jgi:hypothetical protein
MLLHYYLTTELLSQPASHAPTDVPELETIIDWIPSLPVMPLGNFSGFLCKLNEPNSFGLCFNEREAHNNTKGFLQVRVCVVFLYMFMCQKDSLHVHKHTYM